jgi:carbon-monoxide dehydrogenase small subunit
MSVQQLLSRYPDPTVDEIRHQLDGNICRCTGYHSIIKSVQSAAKKLQALAAAGEER